MDIRVLLADDDPLLRHLVRDILAKQGFTAIEAADGEQAMNLFLAGGIDLIILDVMMPIVDGWSVLRQIREVSDVPVVMLTALSDERHEVLGLRHGADDYIAKPFSYELFVARIGALVRRLMRERLGRFSFGSVVVNQAAQEVTVDGVPQSLTLKEYGLLLHLMRHPNQVLSRGQLADAVWGFDFDGDLRTIDTHIKTLRAKVGSTAEFIRTVRGVGYMFQGDVEGDER